MDPVELVDGDLTLRCWRPADAESVYRACQDPEISRWTLVPAPYTRAHAEGFVSTAPRLWANGDRAPFAVVDTGTGELLGSTGLIWYDSAVSAAELGYWTAPWARGRGVAVRAARLVAGWAFERLGLHRLAWRAEVGNHASRLVALRLGARMEGASRSGLRPRDGGAPVDGWVAALLPGELREHADPDDRYSGAPHGRQPRTGWLSRALRRAS